MAHKAIDDHVEGQQPGYATLGTNPENASEFCEASVHVTFYKKAAQFANIQYYRYDSKAKKKNAKTDEIGKNKLGSIASNRSKEKMAIAEFISLTSATTEVSGRVYSRKDIWDALAETTVELKVKKAGGNSNDGKESIGIDRLACDVYNTVIGEDENGDDGDRSRERNNNGDVELPSGFYGETESEDAGSQSNEPSTSNGNNADRNEVEIRTGKGGKKTVRIRRSAVNPLCFKDVMAEGIAKLESRNLPIRRFRRFAREQRRRTVDEAVYRDQKKYSDNGVETEETVMEMAKLNMNV